MLFGLLPDNLKIKDLPNYAVLFSLLLSFVIPGYAYLHVTNRELLYGLHPVLALTTSLMYSLPIISLWLLEGFAKEKGRIKIRGLVFMASMKALLWSYAYVALLGIYQTQVTLDRILYMYLFHLWVATMDTTDKKKKGW